MSIFSFSQLNIFREPPLGVAQKMINHQLTKGFISNRNDFSFQFCAIFRPNNRQNMLNIVKHVRQICSLILQFLSKSQAKLTHHNLGFSRVLTRFSKTTNMGSPNHRLFFVPCNLCNKITFICPFFHLISLTSFSYLSLYIWWP